jgi:hypothetical protein
VASWDPSAAAQFADTNYDHAHPFGNHNCAAYTRQAIENGQGGNPLHRPATNYARDYGPSLLEAGFKEVHVTGGHYQVGDVAVIDHYKGGHPAGHMCIWDGKQWVSDFRQRNETNAGGVNSPYPGDGYRKHHPPFKIYRRVAGQGSSPEAAKASVSPFASASTGKP